MERKEVTDTMENTKECIGIAFEEDDFDEIMAFMDKGEYETVQDAVMFAIRTCSEK